MVLVCDSTLGNRFSILSIVGEAALAFKEGMSFFRILMFLAGNPLVYA